jgi:hypothetical protein
LILPFTSAAKAAEDAVAITAVIRAVLQYGS